MTVFTKSLELFINFSKVIGLINFCFTFDTGLLNWNKNSSYNIFLEIMRTFVFVVSSCHIFFNLNMSYSIHFSVVKYWSLIITARMLENWIIKFINGIICLDRKLMLFNSILLPNVHSNLPRKRFWTIIIILFFMYNLGFRIYFGLHYTVSFIEKSFLLHFLFVPPETIIFVVFFSSCFYLYNVGHRFHVLNCLWQGLPPTLIAVPGKWTNTDIAVLVECIRLLHAELCELLRLFSRAYGPMLLVYFVFTFLHTMLETLLIVIFKERHVTTSVVPFIFYANHIFNMVSILYVTTWVTEKVKIFMQQISFYEPNELAAFGFFNLNLRLIISILVLLIMVIATTMQMRKHPIFKYLHHLLGIQLQYNFKS